MPAASATAPAGTVISTVPAALAIGVTTSVALVPLATVNLPAVPPATVTSLAVKLPPTSLLKAKLKVMSPVAVPPAALLAMVTVGGRVSKACVLEAPAPRLPTRSA